MPSDADVTQRAGSLRALTALTDAEFYALRPQFAQAFVTDRQDRTMDGQPRTSRRDTTDDSCPLLTRADTLLFIPTSVKQHPLQEVQGQRFGMSQSHANTWIQRLHPVLNHALADPERLPARPADDLAARRTTPPSEASAPSPPFVPDGTERPIQRPKDPEEQQDSDRGKKTCHTLNNLLLIKETAPVCFLSHPCAGKASDKSLAERAGYPLPPGSCLYQDKLDFVHFCDLS